MSYENIIVRSENNVAIINLNRPKSLNALNAAMVAELGKAFDEIAADPQVKAVVITGEKNFAAGADITDMVELNPEEAFAFAFSPVFNRIANCPKPVIAAIEGFALGGAMELALCCDIRIAAAGAKMGFPEINLGIFPGAGGTQRLPRLIGPSKAKKLIFTGSIVKGEEALSLGLVDILAENPSEEATKLAGELAGKASVALKLAKECINVSADVDLNTGIAYEATEWARLFATADQKEGMRAFIEKRKASFVGK
ncbi:MAG: enoyl-CoA hydratase/isomerase family protein [Clostridiales Family XIII bacterium]|jgi:enoyl-CoA hydratase|nr:enoyl-CoA hydratase/isomerase family protein [Clostridiales Family XIII bacterium]